MKLKHSHKQIGHSIQVQLLPFGGLGSEILSVEGDSKLELTEMTRIAQVPRKNNIESTRWALYEERSGTAWALQTVICRYTKRGTIGKEKGKIHTAVLPERADEGRMWHGTWRAARMLGVIRRPISGQHR
jgi:hypothetical protein